MVIQNPPRKKTPSNPGPIGDAPGHLDRVRIGGVLLMLGVMVRMLGTVMLLAVGPHLGIAEQLMLYLSSALFVGAGVTSLSRPGWRLWPRGWGLVALGGLLAAEGAGLLGLLSLAVGGEVSAALFLVGLHPAAMVVAAGGLLGHIRTLLRPGASMRRLATAVLAMVVVFLLGWAGMGVLTIALESEIAAVLTALCMMPLPPLAAAVALLMMAQASLSRPHAVAAVTDGLAEAGLTALPATPLPDGARIEVVSDKLACALWVRLDDARLPLAFTVSATLPPDMAGLRIARRGPRSRAPQLGDMVLDQLISVEGMPPGDAAAILREEHSSVLAVIHGHPGSGVRDGVVSLCAAIGAGLRIMPGSTARQRAELQALVTRSAQEVLALQAVLAAEPPPTATAQRARQPERARPQ